jgi:hypothetical protein
MSERKISRRTALRPPTLKQHAITSCSHYKSKSSMPTIGLVLELSEIRYHFSRVWGHILPTPLACLHSSIREPWFLSLFLSMFFFSCFLVTTTCSCHQMGSNYRIYKHKFIYLMSSDGFSLQNWTWKLDFVWCLYRGFLITIKHALLGPFQVMWIYMHVNNNAIRLPRTFDFGIYLIGILSQLPCPW